MLSRLRIEGGLVHSGFGNSGIDDHLPALKPPAISLPHRITASNFWAKEEIAMTRAVGLRPLDSCTVLTVFSLSMAYWTGLRLSRP